MTTASAGAKFERDVINTLKAGGYDCVRGAASKGTLALFIDENGKTIRAKADLIATKVTSRSKGTCFMVLGQCKWGKV